MRAVSPKLNSLPHIREITPLSERDAPLVRDLVGVLKKHKALKRFGLTLLHRHFPFSDDEVLLETTDAGARIQTIRPVSKKLLADEEYIETCWRLDTGQAVTACVCIVRGGEHTGDHANIPGR